jgi:hypothetical protein
MKFSAALPPGVALSTSPLMLYGWPTKPGTYTIESHEKGSLGSSDSLAIPLRVKGAPTKGPAGQIRLALDGKCLQDPRNSKSEGAKVEITNCVSNSTENWTFASDGTIRINSRCLNIPGTTYKGKAVQLLTCNNGPRQQWVVGSDGELVNPASGLCLADPGASRQNGVVPVMGSCAAKSYEQWAIPAQQILTPLSACVDDLHSVGNNGAVVDKYTCDNTIAQTWIFSTNGMIKGGQYPADCLTPHGTKIALYRCASGDKGQRWSVIRAGGLGVELKVGSVCLAMPKLTASDTTQLVTAKCSATNPLDLWHIW